MLKVDATNNKITLTRGDTAHLKLDLKDGDGNAYVPGTEDTIRFAMKKSYNDAEPVVVIDIPTDTMTLTILPEHTKALAFGAYKYDIQLTAGDGTVSTFIDRCTITLTEEVD